MTELQRAFPQTHWSQIFRAGKLSDTEALSELCATYFHPIHAFFLSLGCSRDDAGDAVQSFFEAILRGKVVGHVDATRGRFRTFLRTAARHHLYNGRKGPNPRVGANWSRYASIDATDNIGIDATDPIVIDDLQDSSSPDRLFDRLWARTVVDAAMARLKAQCESDRHRRLAEVLLGDCDEAPSNADLALELGTNQAALRTRRSRVKDSLENRFARYLREEIARTVSSPSRIDEELRYLLEALT